MLCSGGARLQFGSLLFSKTDISGVELAGSEPLLAEGQEPTRSDRRSVALVVFKALPTRLRVGEQYLPHRFMMGPHPSFHQ